MYKPVKNLPNIITGLVIVKTSSGWIILKKLKLAASGAHCHHYQDSCMYIVVIRSGKFRFYKSWDKIVLVMNMF